MANCPKCGEQVSDGALFCARCGASLTAPAEQEAVPQEDIPQEAAIQETVPEEEVREENVQQENVQEETVQQENVQEENVQQEPVPEEPVQQAPVQPAPPVNSYPPAAQQAFAAPAPKAPGSFSQKMKGFLQKIQYRTSEPQDASLLRIVSLLFAVAFILFSLGLCSRILYNRNIGEQIEDNNLKSRETRQLRDVVYAAFRLDPKGVLKGVGFSNSDIKSVDKTTMENFRDVLKDYLDRNYEDYGFALSMYKFGTLYGSLFLWVGLVFALGAAAFWWIKGGRPYNIRQTALLPAITAAGVVFLVLFILNLSVTTCSDFSSELMKANLFQ